MNKLIPIVTLVCLSTSAIAQQTTQPIPNNGSNGAEKRSLSSFNKRDVNKDGTITQQEWLDTVGGRTPNTTNSQTPANTTTPNSTKR